MLQLSVIRTPTITHNHATTPPFLKSKISATHRSSHRRKPEHIRLISNSTSSSSSSSSSSSNNSISSSSSSSSSSSTSSSVTVSSSVMSNTKQSDDDELHIPLLCPPLNQSVAAIVFGDDSSGDSRLYPLTKRRSEGAIPIGANYRLIDAVVSNCINSSITKIYALTQFNSTSLNSHLSRAYSGAGLGKQGFVEVIAAYQSPEDEGWFQGTADAVRRCLWVLEEHPVIEFLVLPGHHLYRMNYQKLIETHRNSNADITLAATFPTRNRDPGYGFVKVAKPENKVTEFLRERPKFEQLNHHLATESSKNSKNGGDSTLGSMGIYVIKRDAMIKILREYFPKANDFATEIIPGAISMGMKVHCHAFDGYWEDLTDIQSFYQANMESTKKATSGFNFYDRDSLVYTLPRCLPPTLMMDATVTDSVIGDGCILNMCDIKRSVIGMRTWIGDRVLIEDSVLMGADIYHTNEEQRCEREGKGMNIPIGIGEGSHIRKAIIDKNVRIGKNVRIINRDNVQEANREAMGYIISGGIVIVLRSAVIPDGTIL